MAQRPRVRGKQVVGDADPYTQRCRFYKTVIPRSEATWESVIPFDKGCGAGVLRIATAGVRTGFAMTGGAAG